MIQNCNKCNKLLQQVLERRKGPRMYGDWAIGSFQGADMHNSPVGELLLSVAANSVPVKCPCAGFTTAVSLFRTLEFAHVIKKNHINWGVFTMDCQSQFLKTEWWPHCQREAGGIEETYWNCKMCLFTDRSTLRIKQLLLIGQLSLIQVYLKVQLTALGFTPKEVGIGLQLQSQSHCVGAQSYPTLQHQYSHDAAPR